MQEIFRASGSKVLSNTWKQEIVVYDRGIRAEGLRVGKRVSITLPYDKVSEVILRNGILTSDLEIASTGAQSIVVKALSKKDAKRAKELIEEHIL